MDLILTSVDLNMTPGSNHSAVIRYKLSTDTTFTTVTTTTIQPDGTFVSPVTISGLVDGNCYDVMVDTECDIFVRQYCIDAGTTTTTTTTSSTTTTTAPPTTTTTTTSTTTTTTIAAVCESYTVTNNTEDVISGGWQQCNNTFPHALLDPGQSITICAIEGTVGFTGADIVDNGLCVEV